jgi:tetratricopeptide (TPR) repeat protein/predicted aspartyl protease
VIYLKKSVSCGLRPGSRAIMERPKARASSGVYMAVRPFAVAALLSALSVSPVLAFANGCKIGKIAELAVTMNGMRPMVTAKINGADAQFIADSGAFFSTIAPASAAEYKLRTQPAPFHLVLQGVGGSAEASITTVKEFTLVGVPIHNVQFVVGGSQPGGEAVGLLGQNVLRLADVEYDLSNGAIRLLKPDGCGKAVMAYWAKADRVFSVIDIAWATALSPHTTAIASLNGAKIRIMFDTGAATSVLSLRAAERAGVKTTSAGVVEADRSHGIGSHTVRTWIAPFESFKIGDEEIRHTKLRIGEIGNMDADMLVGADFFLSHRIYVASSQRKLYFTYNGGPVFNLTASAPAVAESGAAESGAAGAGAADSGAAASSGAAGGPASGSAAADQSAAPADKSAAPATLAADSSNLPKESAPPSSDTPAPAIPAGQPTDAAGFSRRGTAFAARRDFQHAIADLTRACELAPTEPDYFLERGRVRVDNRQPVLAMSDFDQAIKLKPDDVPALVSRAALRLARREEAGETGRGDVIADLDKASSTVAKESYVRRELGNLYVRADAFKSAIAEYDLWLNKHPQDARTAEVLASRCRIRGVLGENLDNALSDCNRALRDHSNAEFALDSRGLVYLRMRNFDKAIADYDAVLRLQPKNASALYGRGVAKVRKGMSAGGQVDIAASKAANPRVAEEAMKFGLAP